jgi:hypothetical protein
MALWMPRVSVILATKAFRLVQSAEDPAAGSAQNLRRTCVAVCSRSCDPISPRRPGRPGRRKPGGAPAVGLRRPSPHSDSDVHRSDRRPDGADGHRPDSGALSPRVPAAPVRGSGDRPDLAAVAPRPQCPIHLRAWSISGPASDKDGPGYDRRDLRRSPWYVGVFAQTRPDPDSELPCTLAPAFFGPATNPSARRSWRTAQGAEVVRRLCTRRGRWVWRPA